MSNKRKIIMPTPEEDAAITAAARSDPDALPLTSEQLAQFKPMRARGRPRSGNNKVPTNVRYDIDVLEVFKSKGEGWQTRMNDVLRDWTRTHRPLEEIIASVKDYTYTSASGPILDICRELATDGRFTEIALVLKAWIQEVPQSEKFLRARLPAITLNSFLALKDILTFEEFLKWESSLPATWSAQISCEALNEEGLPAVVDNILQSMVQFKAQEHKEIHAEPRRTGK